MPDLTPAEAALFGELEVMFRTRPSLGILSKHTGPLSDEAKRAIEDLGMRYGLRMTFPVIGTPHGPQHTVYAVRVQTP